MSQAKAERCILGQTLHASHFVLTLIAEQPGRCSRGCKKIDGLTMKLLPPVSLSALQKEEDTIIDGLTMKRDHRE